MPAKINPPMIPPTKAKIPAKVMFRFVVIMAVSKTNPACSASTNCHVAGIMNSPIAMVGAPGVLTTHRYCHAMTKTDTANAAIIFTAPFLLSPRQQSPNQWILNFGGYCFWLGSDSLLCPLHLSCRGCASHGENPGGN